MSNAWTEVGGREGLGGGGGWRGSGRGDGISASLISRNLCSLCRRWYSTIEKYT